LGREPVYQELLHVQTPPLQPNYPRTPSGWKRLTAFNPGGRDATTRANLRAHHALLHRIDVAGLPWWPAVGGDPSGAHAEPGAAVVGMDDAQARAMGHRFGHDAVFAWSALIMAAALLRRPGVRHDRRRLARSPPPAARPAGGAVARRLRALPPQV
ncbi:DUF3293 domain-containing protein, partial [Streptomyces sp. PA03-1a]|nr:DUF3293 domain-containing protein [Streptomyces sp. PA03-1a]